MNFKVETDDSASYCKLSSQFIVALVGVPVPSGQKYLTILGSFLVSISGVGLYFWFGIHRKSKSNSRHSDKAVKFLKTGINDVPLNIDKSAAMGEDIEDYTDEFENDPNAIVDSESDPSVDFQVQFEDEEDEDDEQIHRFQGSTFSASLHSLTEINRQLRH
jgi:hypothetical protein